MLLLLLLLLCLLLLLLWLLLLLLWVIGIFLVDTVAADALPLEFMLLLAVLLLLCLRRQRAEADLADAAASYGHHSIPSKTLPGQMLLQQHQTAAAAIARQSAARDAASAVSGRSKGSRVQRKMETCAQYVVH